MWLIFIGTIGVAFFSDRNNFWSYFLPYSLAFLGYFLVIYKREESVHIQKIDIVFAILLRFILVFSIPNLSDDYFRFIWDGQLIKEGISPYSITPEDWIYGQGCGKAEFETLFFQLNSKGYYSIYPPLLQVLFFLSVLPEFKLQGSIILLKLFVFCFETISIFLIPRLLAKFEFPSNRGLWYLLNPLIIIELVGNLHFEAIAISFFLMAILSFYDRKVIQSALWMSFSVATKLLPIIFAPILFFRLDPSLRKKFIFFLAVFLIGFFISIYLDATYFNFFKSFTLYFNRFEFNALFYLLVREVGTLLVGYNPIGLIGPGLSLIAFIGMLWILIKVKEDEKLQMFFFILFYLIFSTTVHPWYLSFLIFLSLFTPFKYPLLWSYSVGLSYYQYQNGVYQENFFIILLEYGIWIPLLVYEINRTIGHVQN